jgi:glucosamine--fructose-6-phosphate aminotransferase (isomerizing)
MLDVQRLVCYMNISWPTVLRDSQLVIEVLKKLEGAYALLIKSTHYPGQLVACKRGSPLIFGIKVASCVIPLSLDQLATTQWRDP